MQLPPAPPTPKKEEKEEREREKEIRQRNVSRGPFVVVLHQEKQPSPFISKLGGVCDRVGEIS